MKKVFVCLSVMSLYLAGCSKSNEEALSTNNPGNTGGSANCDTVNMKYSTNVQPIIQANCYSCHGNGNSLGGVSVGTYAQVQRLATNSRGTLIGVITHASGFKPMPQGLPKLSECDINKIKAWIARGALNN